MLPSGLRVLLIGLVLAMPAGGGAHAQIRPLPVPDSSAGTHFGAAVALDGGRALVGASGEAGCGADAGAAHVFERDAENHFVPVARLAPPACEAGRFFGRAVALSGDRAVVAAGGEVVGTGQSNALHVFERAPGGAWREAAVILPPGGHGERPFALSVALDGDRLLATAAGEASGTAYVFERTPAGGWTLAATLVPKQPLPATAFGTEGTLDGDRAVVTASPLGEGAAGAAYVFEREADGTWRPAGGVAPIAARTVHAALDGDLLLVGHGHGGADRTGSAVLYAPGGDGDWRRLATLRPDVPYRGGIFGSGVALDVGPEGTRALVVGYTEQIRMETNVDRVVYVFRYAGEAGWVKQQVLDVGEWAFGAAVALDGRTALVGSASDGAPGAAYAIDLLE